MPHVRLIQGDARRLPLKAGSVQCCVTSPPYWQLRRYLGEDDPLRPHELGQESLHDCAGAFTGANCEECYICHLRAVFSEVWRVLRDDGTLWVNIGDSYWGGGGGNYGKESKSVKGRNGVHLTNVKNRYIPPGLRAKSLCGIPQRLAVALCADGWIWRQELIWHKVNPMPESVTDRCTKAHEQVLLFSKSPQYFWDAEAIREPHTDRKVLNGVYHGSGVNASGYIPHTQAFNGGGIVMKDREYNPSGRNARSVWSLASESFPGAHFATFPQALATRCILAGTPQAGCCPVCRTPWERQVGHGEPNKVTTRGLQQWTAVTGQRDSAGGLPYRSTTTTGFTTACPCDAGPAVPSLVLDPFAGAATTLLAARALGRDSIGVELSAAFLALSRERLGLAALARWEGTASPVVHNDHTDLPLFAGQETR